MITLQYNDGGVAKSIDLAIESLEDLGPILRRFAKHMRTEVDEVFQSQGPGWDPLATGTEERKAGGGKRSTAALAERAQARGLQSLRTKLKGDLRRAVRRRAVGKGKSETVEARYEVLKEFERQAAGGTGRGLLSERKGKSLAGRIERVSAKAQEQQGRILGRLASSIKARVSGQTLEIYSTIPWAGIHNEGGTAGHGARIPARTFLEWTAERVEKLAEIAVEYVTEKMAK